MKRHTEDPRRNVQERRNKRNSSHTKRNGIREKTFPHLPALESFLIFLPWIKILYLLSWLKKNIYHNVTLVFTALIIYTYSFIS